MAEVHNDFLVFNNGEAAAMAPYRRVKIHTTPTEVVYADAADGDSWIGVTEPGLGGNVGVGSPVTVRLRGESRTLKVETTEAVDVGDSLYPENDGKVSDTAGSVVVGTCLSATAASGGVCEMLPNAGSGSVPDEESVAAADGTTGAGIPILLRKTGITASGTTTITRPARALQVIEVMITQLGSTATDVTVQNGATAFTDAIAVGTTTGRRYRPTTWTTASADLTASDVLNVNLATANATGVEVAVLALPI